MANTEGKFTVIRNEDLEEASAETRARLNTVVVRVNARRDIEGKEQDEYIVVDRNADYADEVIKIMDEHGDW